jgi:hypothetical protein
MVAGSDVLPDGDAGMYFGDIALRSARSTFAYELSTAYLQQNVMEVRKAKHRAYKSEE